MSKFMETYFDTRGSGGVALFYFIILLSCIFTLICFGR